VAEKTSGREMGHGIAGVLQLRAVVSDDQVRGVPTEDGLTLQLARLFGQLVAALPESGHAGEDVETKQFPGEAPHVVFVIAGEIDITPQLLLRRGKSLPPCRRIG
jgi:hypothetical protein